MKITMRMKRLIKAMTNYTLKREKVKDNEIDLCNRFMAVYRQPVPKRFGLRENCYRPVPHRGFSRCDEVQTNAKKLGQVEHGR